MSFGDVEADMASARGDVEQRVDQLKGPQVDLPGGPRAWIELSMQWLVEQFGDEPLRRAVVVPSEFIPADYDGSEEAALDLCLKVCAHMGVPTDRIRFSFLLDELRLAALHRVPGELSRTVDDKIAALTAEQLSGLAKIGTTSEDVRAAMLKVYEVAKPAEPPLPEELVTALENSGWRPELEVLTRHETGWAMQRCLAIHQETDPDRRANLVLEAEAHASGFVVAHGTLWGRWMGLKPEMPDHRAILLCRDVLADPAVLIAVVAHEAAHEALYRSGLVPGDRADREPLMDLFAVYQGFGIFLANAAYEPLPNDPRRRKVMGYLGEYAFADALGYHSFIRRDHSPAWRDELHPAVKVRVMSRLDELAAALARPTAPEPRNTARFR